MLHHRESRLCECVHTGNISTTGVVGQNNSQETPGEVDISISMGSPGRPPVPAPSGAGPVHFLGGTVSRGGGTVSISNSPGVSRETPGSGPLGNRRCIHIHFTGGLSGGRTCIHIHLPGGLPCGRPADHPNKVVVDIFPLSISGLRSAAGHVLRRRPHGRAQGEGTEGTRPSGVTSTWPFPIGGFGGGPPGADPIKTLLKLYYNPCQNPIKT